MALSNIIPKTLTEVDVLLDNGEILDGSIYLAEDELPDDVLNSEDPFLLVKLAGGTRMVNKNMVTRVLVRDDRNTTERLRQMPHERVSLILKDGTPLNGVVLLRSVNRVSGEINQAQAFIRFVSDQDIAEYIRTDIIGQVVLEDNNRSVSAADPAPEAQFRRGAFGSRAVN